MVEVAQHRTRPIPIIGKSEYCSVRCISGEKRFHAGLICRQIAIIAMRGVFLVSNFKYSGIFLALACRICQNLSLFQCLWNVFEIGMFSADGGREEELKVSAHWHLENNSGSESGITMQWVVSVLEVNFWKHFFLNNWKNPFQLNCLMEETTSSTV